MEWQPERLGTLQTIVRRLETELPGWWWSIGACSVSKHASIGPDMNGPDKALLEVKKFDDGFHADIHADNSCAKALNICIELALKAKAAHIASERHERLATSKTPEATRGASR
jgi:hypothetical protein